jgi:hypothetical protein
MGGVTFTAGQNEQNAKNLTREDGTRAPVARGRRRGIAPHVDRMVRV